MKKVEQLEQRSYFFIKKKQAKSREILEDKVFYYRY
jgi:hypothetical protein